MISSAVNPLLKDVRRAIARGGLTQEGYLVAETFHLLEEALRSDCAVKVVLCSESVQSAVESHVKRLTGMRVAVVADSAIPLYFRDRSEPGSDRAGAPAGLEPAAIVSRAEPGGGAGRLAGPRQRGLASRAPPRRSAPRGLMFLKGTVSPFNPKALRGGGRVAVPRAFCLRTGFGAGARGAAAEQAGRLRRRAGQRAHRLRSRWARWISRADARW